MKRFDRLRVAVGVLALCSGASAVVEAQKPIRIGASLSLTGAYAALGQNQERGYQLCVKHTNEKGGVLGRSLELVVHDDWSDPATAVRLYERLITQDKVDLVLGPYGSPITQAVANVAEKYQRPMVTHASTTSIFKQGRKFVFMVLSPAEGYLEGLVEMAAKHGLKTMAIINENTLFARAVADGTADMAKKKGLKVVLVQAYPKGSPDFATILSKVRAANPDVLAAATYFDDAVAITRQMKQFDVNPRMYAVTVGGDLPKFYEFSGRMPRSSAALPCGFPSWSRSGRAGWSPSPARTLGPESSSNLTGGSFPARIFRTRPPLAMRSARSSSRPSRPRTPWMARGSGMRS